MSFDQKKEPKYYPFEAHQIHPQRLDPNALFVLKKLQEAGHIAYLVGGGVRDLLMGRKPKDFDISTSALPEEVKKLFRNSLLIGRRFRLAHVRFGNQIIEVSTFRSGDPTDSELIIKDNLWGTPTEDVLRRDFTMNGLFYDPTNQMVIDYVDGFEDLKKHMLRCIGTPEIRFRQDPVRMIRLQKFRARFGFHADPQALEAVELCRHEIKKSAPARVLEELFRMLESGASEDFFRLLVQSQILHILFPEWALHFDSPLGERLYHYLKGVDQLNTRGHFRTLDRGILTAALIFPMVEHQILQATESLSLNEIMVLTETLIETLLFQPAKYFPRRLRMDALAIICLQYRLTPLKKRKTPASRIMKQRLFPAALTFLKLRALLEPTWQKSYEFWKKSSHHDDT